MENNATTQKNSEKLNVRDYITTAICFVLLYVVFAVVGTPVGMSVVGNLFIFAVCAILWGTIYMLLFTKVNKKGVALLFGLILAVLQLMNFWAIALVLAIGAVVSELVWRKLDRHKFSTMLICFTIQIVFWYLAQALPLIFLKDMYLAAVPAYAELYSSVYELYVGPMFFVGFLATVIGCIAGGFIGKLLLKKHFEKAGIV
ncbi:MAG: MptD family putative ECF transporter S component [Clostridia bacterium]|nr:MptD family putative ECF transporter S component [Clostridia bacterium]